MRKFQREKNNYRVPKLFWELGNRIIIRKQWIMCWGLLLCACLDLHHSPLSTRLREGTSPGQLCPISFAHRLWMLILQSLHRKPCLKTPLSWWGRMEGRGWGDEGGAKEGERKRVKARGRRKEEGVSQEDNWLLCPEASEIVNFLSSQVTKNEDFTRHASHGRLQVNLSLCQQITPVMSL